MPEIVNAEKLKEALSKFENILVVFGQDHSFDDLAAGLSLGLSLEKTGKKITIFSPKPALVEEASLFGISKITNKLNSGNLIISIPNALNSVDKVTHYLDGETLNIVVHPVFAGDELSAEKVSINKAGNLADLVILINTAGVGFLDKLNTQEQKSYSDLAKFIIGKTFSTSGNEIMLNPVESVSVSETVVWLLTQFGLPVDGDCASNLFQGMKFATNFEPPKAVASTFEAASICLAKKPVFPQIQMTVQKSQANQTVTPAPRTPQDQTKSDFYKTSQKIGKQDLGNEDATEDTGKVQSDWLVPKIFKSSSKTDKS